MDLQPATVSVGGHDCQTAEISDSITNATWIGWLKINPTIPWDVEIISASSFEVLAFSLYTSKRARLIRIEEILNKCLEYALKEV